MPESSVTRKFGPVSYTHLDVYKRQGEYETAAEDIYLDVIHREKAPYWVKADGHEPVSYTHLDVYKRQIFSF